MTGLQGDGGSTHEWLMEQVAERIASGETAPRPARDAVNQPMINNWIEAIGDANPDWQSGIAPPAMAQVWTMYGLDPERPAGDPLHGTMQLLDKAGYTSVLGTNADQTYVRPLRLGERVSVTSRLDFVVGPKTTGVGEGYFVTTTSTWRVDSPDSSNDGSPDGSNDGSNDGDGEVVGTMVFRVLKFRPRATPAVDPTRTLRPQVSRDSAYFWEGTAAGELRIQSCNACGALRHPPGPVCVQCLAMDRGYVVASGRGTVHSWLVHHAPQVPGKVLPLRLALVELPEGVRMVGELRDELEIGDPVEVVFQRIDDELTLPQWRGVAESRGFETGAERLPQPPGVEEVAKQPSRNQDVEELPPWELPITRTLVVSTALATRDFQDVHHDPDLAVQRGTKDIFLNILTTTGLVQRYVGEWAGPGSRVTACALRLGAPAYPGDTLAFTGSVGPPDEHGAVVVDVTGTVSIGMHVSAQVTVVLP